MIGMTYSVANYEEYKETGDANLFEEVIDDMMLEKYSDDKELAEYVKSLPRDSKRIGTLSLLSKDNVLWSKINDIHNSDKTKYQKIKLITLALRDYVKMADVKRKEHGEVLTPFNELAKPMVNLMDKYDVEFWKNPNHKVLDSSAGYGTFLILCLYKFMEGLKDVIIDEDERLKHIIENQLYYGELQSKSVFSWLVSVDIKDEYTTNTYWGSFLEEGFDYHMKEVWEVEKFDLIIQNPPYQMQKDTDKNLKSKSPKTQPLWHLFVKKSLSLLKEDGFMIMVHPGGWRDISGVFKETQILLKSKQILELNMFPYKSGLEIFGAKINFDYYILKNTENVKNTKIICENGEVESLNLSKLVYIPGENISYINSLLGDGEKVEIISNSSYHTQQGVKKGFLSKEKTDEFIYPCVYMVSHVNVPTFWYSNIDKGHFGIPKVIWGNGSSGVIVDDSGEYGLTQFARSIVDEKENLENIKIALESDKFIKEVMLFKNGLGHKYNFKVISMLKKDFWKEFINEKM